MTTEFGPALLRRALVEALAAVKAHQAEIDEANVYPVPDGDTGTNMALTLEAAAVALEGPDAGLFGHVARAALVGARGNSGVILSQWLGGLLSSGEMSAEGFRGGLARASKAADAAVLEPVEGTILTVARAAAEGASGQTVPEVLESASRAARAGLERTPELLPVLADAGVLDAGGLGLWVVIDAFAAAATGRAPAAAPASLAPRRAKREAGSSAYAYEVQYLLEAPDGAASDLRARLGVLGDSVVVSGGAGLWNVHVHTNDTEGAVTAGRVLGSIRSVTIASFAEQMSAPSARQIPLARPGARVTVLAVVAGDGMRRTFGELGAGVLIDGGETMNPSVGELMDAIATAPTNDIIVLPNNADALPAALHAARSAEGKRVEVVQTHDLAHGFETILAYADARDLGSNLDQMRRAASVATSARIVVAVRDATTPAGPVRAGQSIVFVGSQARLIDDDPERAVLSLAKLLDADEPLSALTLFRGASAPAEEADRIAAALHEALPGVEIEHIDGGQPVERYLVAAE